VQALVGGDIDDLLPAALAVGLEDPAEVVAEVAERWLTLGRIGAQANDAVDGAVGGDDDILHRAALVTEVDFRQSGDDRLVRAAIRVDGDDTAGVPVADLRRFTAIRRLKLHAVFSRDSAIDGVDAPIRTNVEATRVVQPFGDRFASRRRRRLFATIAQLEQLIAKQAE